jgi:polyferredoxin
LFGGWWCRIKPSTKSSVEAAAYAISVAIFAAIWYVRTFIWLGIGMSLLTGTFVFLILRAKKIQNFRRVFYLGLFFVSITSLTIIVGNMDLSSFLSWARGHTAEYYLPGQYIGTLSYPCTRQLAQVLLGRANYLPDLSAWQTAFPRNLDDFLILMIPYAFTGLFFGRGFCGWICPFGGLNELMVTGKKERWSLNFLKKKAKNDIDFRYSGLKDWVKDTKYGILLSVVLLSIFLSFPLVCVYCPVFWLSATPLFWSIAGLIVVFAVVLPFMNKHRWWCQICPLGAVAGLVDKINLFRLRIDKNKCVKCLDCVNECRMFAMSPRSVYCSGTPDADCIRCGRCIEICPEGAIELSLLNTHVKIRALFITLAVCSALAWYAWFVIILADKFFH